MDTKDFSSSYRITPKAPDNWVIKTYRRGDRTVPLINLKSWQLDAFLDLKDAPFGFIRAFCGSGKTIAARAIAVYKIFKTKKRQVFCVPKNDIGNDGFASFFDIELPIGKANRIFHCDSPYNFCDSRSESKIDQLIKILTRKPVVDKSISNNHISSSMMIVCTHQCLTLAIRKIKDDPYLMAKFIENNTFWIDEGHHIKGHDESDEEKVSMNLLGKFVNFVIDSSKDSNNSVELFAMTATPYRGDYSRLFSLEQMDNFADYSLDFLDHFPTLGIESVNIDFEIYKDHKDVCELVADNIGKEINRKHFVFVPPTGRKWRKNKNDVDRMFSAIYKVLMKKLSVSLEEAKSKVLDLVTESTQTFNDKLLRQEPKNGQNHESKYTVVVACMKCREGSDWCPADRLHNTSMENSPPLNFQTNGRLFRMFAGKKDVKIRYYVENFKTVAENKREFISNTVNSMLHYMLMDDLFNPIMVDIPLFVSDSKGNKKVKRSKTSIEEIFGHNYQEMKKNLLNSLEVIYEFNEQNIEFIINKSVVDYLPNIEDYSKGQITDIKTSLKAFILRARSGELRKRGIDASFIRENGFDVVVAQNGLQGNIFTSKLNQKEFERFRENIKRLQWDGEQIKFIINGVEKLVAKELKVPSYIKDRNTIEGRSHCRAGSRISLEINRFHKAYVNVSKSNDFSIQNLAKELQKPVDYVERRIDTFNRYVMPNGFGFDFKENSYLANKIPSQEAA